MIVLHPNHFNNENQKSQMSKPLIWLPKIQENLYEVIESVINDTISKDPLLFLTYPTLAIVRYNNALQKCILYAENSKMLFTYYYSTLYENKFFNIELTTYTNTSSYDRVKVSLNDKILHDDINNVDPFEKDIPQCKGLEILYKLKLIGVKQ